MARTGAVLLVSTAVLLSVVHVHSWGLEGHAIIGNIAERLLTAQARNAINILTGNRPLSDYASEADSWDHHAIGCRTSQCHFVSVVDPSQPLTAEVNCPHRFDDTDTSINMCVFGCLLNNTNTLRNAQNTPRSCICTPPQIMSDPYWPTDYPLYPTPCELELIVHYVGDTHQPFHVGGSSSDGSKDDKGGNLLCVKHHYKMAPTANRFANDVYGENAQTVDGSYQGIQCSRPNPARDPAFDQDPSYASNPANRYDPKWGRDANCKKPSKALHGVWDSDLIRHLMYQSKVGTWSGLADALWKQKDTYITTADNYNSDDDFVSWAKEAYDLSTTDTVRGGCDRSKHTCGPQNPVTLDEDYYTAAIEVVKQQLLRGGVRLAGLLNSIFKTANVDAANYENVQCPAPAQVTGASSDDTGRFDMSVLDAQPASAEAAPATMYRAAQPPKPAARAQPAATHAPASASRRSSTSSSASSNDNSWSSWLSAGSRLYPAAGMAAATGLMAARHFVGRKKHH